MFTFNVRTCSRVFGAFAKSSSADRWRKSLLERWSWQEFNALWLLLLPALSRLHVIAFTRVRIRFKALKCLHFLQLLCTWSVQVLSVFTNRRLSVHVLPVAHLYRLRCIVLTMREQTMLEIKIATVGKKFNKLLVFFCWLTTGSAWADGSSSFLILGFCRLVVPMSRTYLWFVVALLNGVETRRDMSAAWSTWPNLNFLTGCWACSSAFSTPESSFWTMPGNVKLLGSIPALLFIVELAFCLYFCFCYSYYWCCWF